MTLIILSKIPKNVYGRIGLWFLEVSRNIFISNIPYTKTCKVIRRLYRLCDTKSKITVVRVSGYRYEVKVFGGGVYSVPYIVNRCMDLGVK